jgi:hypothetical protein
MVTDETGFGWTLYSPEEADRLGFTPLDEPSEPTPEFDARCRAALAIVHRDLDVTGYGEFVMYPVNLLVGGDVEMWAALPDGRSWGGGGVGGMTPDMDDSSILWHAAASVSDTLMEVRHEIWPQCKAHGYPMRPPHGGEAEDGLIEGKIWWWCSRGQHAVTPVGDLTDRLALSRPSSDHVA